VDVVAHEEVAEVVRLDSVVVEAVDRREGCAVREIIQLGQFDLLNVELGKHLHLSLNDPHQAVLDVVRYLVGLEGGPLRDDGSQLKIVGSEHELHEIGVTQLTVPTLTIEVHDRHHIVEIALHLMLGQQGMQVGCQDVSSPSIERFKEHVGFEKILAAKHFPQQFDLFLGLSDFCE
jgi:hypothetical protein